MTNTKPFEKRATRLLPVIYATVSAGNEIPRRCGTRANAPGAWIHGSGVSEHLRTPCRWPREDLDVEIAGAVVAVNVNPEALENNTRALTFVSRLIGGSAVFGVCGNDNEPLETGERRDVADGWRDDAGRACRVGRNACMSVKKHAGKVQQTMQNRGRKIPSLLMEEDGGNFRERKSKFPKSNLFLVPSGGKPHPRDLVGDLVGGLVGDLSSDPPAPPDFQIIPYRSISGVGAWTARLACPPPGSSATPKETITTTNDQLYHLP